VYDCADYEGVPLIDAASVLDDEGNVTVFCVNRDMKEDYELEIDLRSFGDLKYHEHIMLHHDDVKAVNTEEDPMNVAPCAGPAAKMDHGRAHVVVPSLSWNVIRFTT
jgi:alpha-N-arabinofuranosidase